MNVSLRTVDKDNYRAVCDLPLPDEQYKFISDNSMSILESHFEDGVTPRAIYLDDEPVGFIMWAETSKTEVIIYRFMVTFKQQKKGIGGKALQLAFDEIKTDKNIEKIEIYYSPDNVPAKGLYMKTGFVETGMSEDGEDMLAVIDVVR